MTPPEVSGFEVPPGENRKDTRNNSESLDFPIEIRSSKSLGNYRGCTIESIHHLPITIQVIIMLSFIKHIVALFSKLMHKGNYISPEEQEMWDMLAELHYECHPL